MDTVQSLNVLSVCMEVSFTVLATMLAVAFAAMAAGKLSPFSPSDSQAYRDARDQFYLETQMRLAQARSARYKKVNEVPVCDVTTRKLKAQDDTVPDLKLAETFSVVPMRTMPVGGVLPLSVVRVG